MTDRELMHEVLEALESLHRTGDTQVFDMCAAPVLIPALRERLAQPEQEPNYWLGYGLQAHTEKPFEGATPLYTSPPQRKPLTHPQIHEFDWPDGVSFEDILLFVRAIEAAHGIKGKA